jgi:hypothetical protein
VNDQHGQILHHTAAPARPGQLTAHGHVTAVRALLIDVLTGQQLAAVAEGLGEVARRLSAAND